MKYIIDIKGEIEGDYEIIGKYEERPMSERKPGEWKPYTYVDPYDWHQDKEIRYRCSRCGVEVINKSNFCPHCGADMRGNQND